MEERHLSLSEAIDVLGISERTGYRWIKSGKLRAYKPGRDYWIPESAIKEVVEESKVRPKLPAPSPELSLFNGLEEERRLQQERAVPERPQRGLAVLYHELAKKGRSIEQRLKAGQLDELSELEDYDAAAAFLAQLRGRRDIRGHEPDKLAEAIDEFEAADNDIQALLRQDLSADLSEEQQQQLAEFRRKRSEKSSAAEPKRRPEADAS